MGTLLSTSDSLVSMDHLTFFCTSHQTFKDGSIYRGEWVHGRRQGEGTLTFKMGRYVGAWENGMRHGRGVEELGNGERYEGEWAEGLKQGVGTYFWDNAEVVMVQYHGEWQRGCMHGQGKMLATDGDLVIYLLNL